MFWFLMWYLSGLLGSGIAIYCLWYDGEEVAVGDIISGAVAALFGPIWLICVIISLLSILDKIIVIKSRHK